jgi:hypothetical protein
MRVVYDTFDENKGYIENKNRRYYFKLNGNDCIELVVEKIAKKLGICSAHYMLTKYDGKEFYLSDSLDNEGIFMSAESLGIDGSNLYNIWYGIEKLYPGFVYELMQEIIRIYIMDILLMNYDRTDLNWGLYYKNGTLRIAIIDSEMAFSIASSYMSCVNEVGPFDYVRINDDESEIVNFLNVSSQEYVDMFKEIFSLLTPEYVQKVFEEVEQEIGRNIRGKELYTRIYNDHYQNIKNLLGNDYNVGEGLGL